MNFEIKCQKWDLHKFQLNSSIRTKNLNWIYITKDEIRIKFNLGMNPINSFKILNVDKATHQDWNKNLLMQKIIWADNALQKSP